VPKSAAHCTAGFASSGFRLVGLHLMLGGLNGMRVGVGGMSVREVRVMAFGLVLSIGRALRRRAVLRCGEFEMFGREFVVVFQLLHGLLLGQGLCCCQ